MIFALSPLTGIVLYGFSVSIVIFVSFYLHVLDILHLSYHAYKVKSLRCHFNPIPNIINN